MIPGIDKYFVPIVVERKTQITDAWGNPKYTYAPVMTINGVVRELAGDEPHSAGKDTPVSKHRLYCRKTALAASDRITYQGKTYEIKDIKDVMNFGELLQVELEYIG